MPLEVMHQLGSHPHQACCVQALEGEDEQGSAAAGFCAGIFFLSFSDSRDVLS
jgi:hypothetical protein